MGTKREPTVQEKKVKSFAKRTENAVPYEEQEPVDKAAIRKPQIVTPEEPVESKSAERRKSASKKSEKSVK